MISREFVRGAKAAASLAGEYNGSTTHAYRLEDCILCKMNVIARRQPRKNKRKLPRPTDLWMHGFAVALAEMHRKLPHGNDSSGVCEVARGAGLTIKVAKSIGVAPFDWKELKRAGVPER